MADPAARARYTNPLVNHDVPDPDAIALASGGYALVASSFDRAPGLPLWYSDDLMQWHPVGHAGGYREDSPADGGVWAPSIREHDGRLYIVWGDPDLGILVTDAARLEGPWAEPRLLRSGRGLIDPCPHWDEEGRAWLVHGYARSRTGFANRIDIFEASPDLTAALTPSRTIIDGDRIPNCTVLEGPKVYQRDSKLWIFAPAGGVETGWQYVFRADSWDGPWERRIVLEQGSTAVNGPHQGAWLEGADGEEWFLHFQATGTYGRVLHLQPLTWDAEGWPVVGDPEEPGYPVASWHTPLAGTTPAPLPLIGDDFLAERRHAAWHTRGALPEDLVLRVGDGRLTLSAHPDGALLRPLNGSLRSIEVPVLATSDAAASFVVSDATLRELTLSAGASRCMRAEIVTRTASNTDALLITEDLPPESRIGVRLKGEHMHFTLNGKEVGASFPLTGRRWTGAEWGLAARGTGTVTFGAVEVTA